MQPRACACRGIPVHCSDAAGFSVAGRLTFDGQSWALDLTLRPFDALDDVVEQRIFGGVAEAEFKMSKRESTKVYFDGGVLD